MGQIPGHELCGQHRVMGAESRTQPHMSHCMHGFGAGFTTDVVLQDCGHIMPSCKRPA